VLPWISVNTTQVFQVSLLRSVDRCQGGLYFKYVNVDRISKMSMLI
jgi:hypothetical protein